ncbi:permease [Actinomycetospora straminea]|uniref:permease n=1 Tax=Actinomycetospora straminea TaxID=663607 RepID=UPI002365667E|nr:permease [Actinomycetospora straminea]MDD7936107.1 permease [Actinomycetospora straminea]
MTDARVEVRRRTGPPPWAVLAGFAVLVVGGLLWAKWAPYWVKVPSVAGSHSLGPSILTGGEPAPPGVSLGAGVEFAGTYFLAIWPALVVGLVLAAAVRVALPSAWIARVFGAGVRGGVRGSALALPSLMCSCCAAPVAVGLRRRAADLTATLAYWLANPALNPVVLAFCAFVLPWPWTVLRAAAGVAVVVAAVALGRWWARRAPGDAVVDAADVVGVAEEPSADGRPLVVRFLRALGGLAVRLLPEYLLLVVALGAFRGVLFPVGASWLTGTGVVLAVVAVVLLAVAGTLLPIPTGAEVAVVVALLAVGVSGPLAAALLVTLPAVSLPSLLMVRSAFPRRLLVAVTGSVVAVGLLTSAGAWAVGL